MRTRGSLSIGLTVSLGLACKAVSFDPARKAFAFADTDNIDAITDCKDINRELVAFLDLIRLANAKFSQEAQRGEIVALEVAQLTTR